MRIEFCGNIASGKTSLTNIFEKYGYKSINENYRSCPFLESFYLDLQSFALETEFFFPLDHLHQINKSKCINIICDYSFALDYAYSKLVLNDRERAIYLDLLKIIIGKIEEPHKIVRICCQTDDLLDRIKTRNRKHERTLTYEFLQKLEYEIDMAINELYPNIDVITINNSNTDDIDEIAEKLKNKLSI